MIRSSDDEETKTSSSSAFSEKKAMFRQKSSQTIRSKIDSGLRRHSTGSDLQGKNSTSIQIEMGVKEGVCETPFKL